jgi:hypothetical protein
MPSSRPGGPAEALAKLLDELPVEPVVAAEGDLARQAPFAGPTGDRIRRDAEKPRDL